MKQCPNCKTPVVSIKEAAENKHENICYRRGNKIVCLKCNAVFTETEDGAKPSQGADPIGDITNAVYERIKADQAGQDENDEDENDQDENAPDEGGMFGLTDGEF